MPKKNKRAKAKAKAKAAPPKPAPPPAETQEEAPSVESKDVSDAPEQPPKRKLEASPSELTNSG